MDKRFKFTLEDLSITLILILSAILNFANLKIEGFANTYYSAGVRSMLMNFKNFFFVSFDPSGFVSIDKPPLGFWIQTLSAKIFGFSGWSVIFPQALAGVLSVWIIYYLIKRTFGTLAGLVAALCLAVTPIFVAASRNNTIDNLLVLCLLLSCLPLFIAAERGKFKYLLLSLIVVGIGFNIKMVEAYLIAPAIYITYFFSSALPYKRKFKHLVLGSVVLLLVSLSWALIVDLVPANNRPFVGSSSDNSVLQLIIGHNGLERIGIGGRNGIKGRQQNFNNKPDASKQNSYNKRYDSNANKNIGNINQAGVGTNSKTGLTRLFYCNNLSDQISWLLPFAIIAFLAAAIKEKLNFPFDSARKLSLIFWFLWLLTEFIYFSFSKNVTHSYYLTTMAPSVAALTGIGLSAMLKLYRDAGWKKYFLPIAFIINGLIEVNILSANFHKSTGYRVVMVSTAILSIVIPVILIIIVLPKKFKDSLDFKSLTKFLASVAFIGIMVAPTVWSFTTLFYPMNGSSPAAGLELKSNKGNKTAGVANNSKLIHFLDQNRANSKYIVAVPSATTYASDIILESGKPVLTIGGFSGSDNIITLNEFKQLVASGGLRYAIVSSNGRMGGNYSGMSSNSAIMNWIKENGKLVPYDEWRSTPPNHQNGSQDFNQSQERASGELYDLSSYSK